MKTTRTGRKDPSVFLSWSGDRSHRVALELRDWIPHIIPGARLWVSSEDIASGTLWTQALFGQLAQARMGIICLTPENLTEPWILFESGMLLKFFERNFVCPYLLDLRPSDLKGPLSLFQAEGADENGTRRLLHTINTALGSPQNEPELERQLGKWWGDLNKVIEATRTAQSRPRWTREDLLQNKLDFLTKTLNQLIDQQKVIYELLGRFQPVPGLGLPPTPPLRSGPPPPG